jgi:hypothetical protein
LFSKYFNGTTNVLSPEQLKLLQNQFEGCGYGDVYRKSLVYPPKGKLVAPASTPDGWLYKRHSLNETQSIIDSFGCDTYDSVYTIIADQNPWYTFSNCAD